MILKKKGLEGVLEKRTSYAKWHRKG